MLKKVMVEFIFECDDNKTDEQIKKCLDNQIITDLNEYYQNDDDTAQMRSVGITSITNTEAKP